MVSGDLLQMAGQFDGNSPGMRPRGKRTGSYDSGHKGQAMLGNGLFFPIGAATGGVIRGQQVIENGGNVGVLEGGGSGRLASAAALVVVPQIGEHVAQADGISQKRRQL